MNCFPRSCIVTHSDAFFGGLKVSLRNKWFIFFAVVSSTVFAADVPQEDHSYRCKRLPNGLTYYIKKNTFPENRASLRLIVKAGSIHEEEHQRGLAHFLEHMLFRGSENFADWEVINFLESIGAQFGPDTNAYTSFDRTVYQLEIPLEKEGVLEKGVLICSDWAGRASIKDELVEKERKVVADEYNLNMKQATSRQFRKIFERFLGNSIYHHRWPIGLKEVILNCDPQSIRDFYNKWYTPDRMAFVVVGDIDEDQAEAMIIKHFSTLQTRKDEVAEPDTSLHFPSESIFEVFQDDEQMVNCGLLWSFVDLFENSEQSKTITEEAIKKSIYQTIFLESLANRLNDLTKQHPAPFVSSFPLNLELSRIGIRGVGFVPFEDRPYEGMTSILREIARIWTFGPSASEFNHILAGLKEDAITQLANYHRIEHHTLVEDYLENFLFQFPVYNHEQKGQYKLSLFDLVNREDMLQWLKQEGFEPFEHIVYQVSDAGLVNVKEIEGTIEAWLKEEVVDKEGIEHKAFEIQSNKSDLIGENEVQKVYDEKLKSSTIFLKNGMKIVLQPTNLEKNQISMQFIAAGGKTLLSDDLLAAADSIAIDYARSCGLGNLNGEQLDRFLSDSNMNLNYSLHLNQRLVTLTSNGGDIELMAQLAKGAFTERRRDLKVFNSLIDRHTEAFKNLEKNPYMYFYFYLAKHYRDNNPMFIRHKPSEVSEEAAIKIMDLLFSDPTQFSLVVVGDFSIEKAEAVLLELFGNLVGDKISLPVCQSLKTYPEKSENITISRGKESHCLTCMLFGGPFSFEYIQDMELTNLAFDHLLGHRLLEKVRREMGETYSVHVNTYFPFAPNLDELVLVVSFACEPGMADPIKTIVQDEVARLVDAGVSDEEINTAREILLEQERVSFLSNQGYLKAHLVSELFKKNASELIDYQTRLETQLAKERLEAFIQAVFTKNRHLVSYSIKPEGV